MLGGVIPAKSAGIERRKFWNNWILAGAESDEVVLRDVFVPYQSLITAGDTSVMDPLQCSGLIWFEMLAAASYVGVATSLA